MLNRRRRPGARRHLLGITVALATAILASGPAAPPSRATLPLAGIVVALDPGHNGGNASHPTTIARRVWIGNAWKPCNKVGTATTSGFSEHRFAYLVARLTQTRLQALGATVYLTRPSDTGVGPCIDVRGRFGARVKAVLMVSIHADGAPSRYRGFFVMRPGVVRGYTDDIARSSAVLAAAVRRGLLGVGVPVANYYATNGIKTRTDLGTLNWSDVPAVEVELGNMKNRIDAARMTRPTGRVQYANGLVAGIRYFVRR